MKNIWHSQKYSSLSLGLFWIIWALVGFDLAIHFYKVYQEASFAIVFQYNKLVCLSIYQKWESAQIRKMCLHSLVKFSYE
jgi:hypothetical protein